MCLFVCYVFMYVSMYITEILKTHMCPCMHAHTHVHNYYIHNNYIGSVVIIVSKRVILNYQSDVMYKIYFYDPTC